MHHHTNPVSRFILLATSMLMVASPTLAAPAATAVPEGFTSEVRGTQRAVYDSNPIRLTTGAEETFGSITTPELLLRWKTPISHIESDSKVNINIFDNSDYDSVDLHQRLLFSRNNQRWKASVKANFDHETTRTAELTNYSLNLPKVKTTRIGASPEISFAPSPHDRFVLGTSASDVSYNNAAYVDYNIYSITPSYEHRFDHENLGFIGITAQRYEAADNSLTSDSIGPSLGWTHEINPRLTLRTSAGALSTSKKGTNAGLDREQWNYVFSGNLNYAGEQDTLQLTATRAREPFGNGTETLLDTFSVSERHQLNDDVVLNASGKYQSADYSSAPGVNLDEGYSAGAGISYALTAQTDLSADYNFRHEDLTNVTSAIKQHIVMVGVSYRPSWGRE